MTFVEITELAKLALAILGGCFTIVLAIIVNTFKVGKTMQGIIFELQSLGKSMKRIEQTMDSEIIPKINGHSERILAIEYHLKNKQRAKHVS